VRRRILSKLQSNIYYYSKYFLLYDKNILDYYCHMIYIISETKDIVRQILVVPDRSEIVGFLKKFKKLVSEKKFYILGDRNKNRKTLIKLNITESIRKDCILNLTDLDYCKGPLCDDIGKGKIWVFGLEIDNKEVYIKLKIDEYKGDEYAKCLSFHIAEHKLEYPFKKRRE